MGIPFAEVALHTIMDNLKKDIRLEKKQDGIGNHVIKVHTKNGQVMDVDEGQEKMNKLFESGEGGKTNYSLLKTLKLVTNIGLPLTFALFALSFFVAGAIIIASYPDD